MSKELLPCGVGLTLTPSECISHYIGVNKTVMHYVKENIVLVEKDGY